jgi:hypothetical protein
MVKFAGIRVVAGRYPQGRSECLNVNSRSQMSQLGSRSDLETPLLAEIGWTPLLAEIGCGINVPILQLVKEEIRDTVEIKRVRTALDPSGRSSYVFRLNSVKFPVLRLLRVKEDELSRRVMKRQKGHDKELSGIREEILELENSIQLVGLSTTIAGCRKDIDDGLSVSARLDTLLARAAFGVVHAGIIPNVQLNGEINVKGFRHPTGSY